MQLRLTRLLALSLLITSAAACGSDDTPDTTGPTQQFARLRIVNAADIADVQVRRTGTATPLATDLDFRGVTQSCVQVSAGEQALVFSSGGVDLATTAFTFEADKRYTAFLVASGTTRRAVVSSDNETASTGNNALRIINATTAPGDVYVTEPTGAPGPAFLAHGNMGVLATSNAQPAYVHRNTAHTRIRLFNVGTTTGTPRADFTLANLPASRLATVVLTEAGTPAGPTAFMVTPCS